MTTTVTRKASKTGNSKKSNRWTPPVLTAETAKHFDGPSLRSIAQVYEGIAVRTAEGIHTDCTCKPYEDTFTYERWKALGFQVNKGEHAIKIATFVPTGRSKKELDKAGKEVDAPLLIPKTVCLFCRCSVKPIEEKDAGTK